MLGSRRIFLIGIMIATWAPAQAFDSAWPNKPGKKPAARLVVGAQAGATAPRQSDVVIGAGAASKPGDGGDYGFVARERVTPSPPQRAVGYDPKRRIGNKAPSS